MGSVVIPAEIRRIMGINQKNPIEIYIVDDNIILKKVEPECTFCGSENSLHSFKGKKVCLGCIKKIYAAATQQNK